MDNGIQKLFYFFRSAKIFKIAWVLLFTEIAIATSTNLSASSDREIYAFDQNPAGSDKGNEWVILYNPSNELEFIP
jgi:hypothetical protein